MKRQSVSLLTILIIVAEALNVCGQSTTPWIHVGPSGNGTLKRNASYVTVRFVHCRLNPKANWWTKLIATQKTAVVIAETTGKYDSGKGAYADKRSSPPRGTKWDKPIDIAWSQPLAVNLPATFQSLNVSVTVGTSAKDGADQLLKTANEISSKIPNPTPTQNVLGIISTAKTLVDFLVGSQLEKNQVACDKDLLSNEAVPFPAGEYVVLAGDTANDYAKYVAQKDKLSWDGATLNLNGKAIDDASYFVVSVSYLDRVLPDKTKDSLSNMNSAWALLYKRGFLLVDEINLENLNEIKKKMAGTFQSAHAVLDVDPDFIQGELDEIHENLMRIASEAVKKKVDDLKAGNNFLTEGKKRELDKSVTDLRNALFNE